MCSANNIIPDVDTDLVRFGEEAGGQHRVFRGLQTVGGAL